MRALFLVALLWSCVGCPALAPPGPLPSVGYTELPTDVPALLQIADSVYRRSRRVDDLVRARTALKKAEHVGRGGYETWWRLARLNSVLARFDEGHAAEWAREGLDAGSLARAAEPDRVEGHLYFAACAGLLAKHQPAKAESLLKDLMAAAQRANELDPHFSGGEARRIMGAIYIYAPPWPGGIGDLDEAIDVLRALYADHPEAPLNVFYLAEAYRRAEQPREALALYGRVLQFKKRGQWALEGRPYRAEAKRRIGELRKQLRGP